MAFYRCGTPVQSGGGALAPGYALKIRPTDTYGAQPQVPREEIFEITDNSTTYLDYLGDAILVNNSNGDISKIKITSSRQLNMTLMKIEGTSLTQIFSSGQYDYFTDRTFTIDAGMFIFNINERGGSAQFNFTFAKTT